jgi:hypothetical protein
MDDVDENLIYDDCASLPNYIMCARQRALLATTAESAFFFVGAFSLFCPAAVHRLQHLGVSLWRAFVGFLSLFSLEVRALRVAKGVFSFCFGKEYCVLGGRRE